MFVLQAENQICGAQFQRRTFIHKKQTSVYFNSSQNATQSGVVPCAKPAQNCHQAAPQRQTDRQLDGHTDIQTYPPDIQNDRHMERQDRQKYRHTQVCLYLSVTTYILVCLLLQIATHRYVDKHTYKHTYTLTQIHTDKTDRNTDIHRSVCIYL